MILKKKRIHVLSRSIKQLPKLERNLPRFTPFDAVQQFCSAKMKITIMMSSGTSDAFDFFSF